MSRHMLCELFLVRGAGLEPARAIRPRDFKSLVSTNSTTCACIKLRCSLVSSRTSSFCAAWIGRHGVYCFLWHRFTMTHHLRMCVWRHLRVTLPSTWFCRPMPNFSAKAPFLYHYTLYKPCVWIYRITSGFLYTRDVRISDDDTNELCVVIQL